MDFKAKAGELTDQIGADMIDMDLSGSEAKRKHNALIATALREAYEAGRSSAKSYCKPKLPLSTNNLIGD